ncbi:MAG: hypothetical protein ABJ218_05485 [Winogradskyella arenosi]
MKKIFFTLFLIGLITFFFSLLFWEFENFSFYISTFGLTILGVLLYPFSNSFETRSDFLFLPFIIFVIFSIINLVWIKSYEQSLSILNLIFGIFGFGMFYLKQRKKLA